MAGWECCEAMAERSRRGAHLELDLAEVQDGEVHAAVQRVLPVCQPEGVSARGRGCKGGGGACQALSACPGSPVVGQLADLVLQQAQVLQVGQGCQRVQVLQHSSWA